ncbi:MAG: helix-turn-helix domain-containing protein [Bacteroidota bacterium]
MYQIAVILTDARRRILWVNEDFTHITGYTYEEVVGRIPGDLLQGPLTEEEAIEKIRSGLRNMVPVKSDITNYRKNGSSYLCKLVIHPVFANERELTNFIAFEVDGDEVGADKEIPLLNIDQKYRSSSLKGIDELKLYSRIRAILEIEELYLDPSLSLKTLADKLETNTKYLSQVVNHCSGHNFQQFINTYRIERVKYRLNEGAHEFLTLFGVAQQCGFKNKSTFYKVFKDITGLTPKEYLEDLVA